MPKYKIDKPSITAERLKYKLSFDYVAKQCGMTYAQLHGVMYHKSSIVSEKTYLALSKFFEFDEVTGLVVSIPIIEQQEQLKQERKQAIIEQIRASERRRLIKIFISSFLYILGACAIIAFGLSEFWG